MKGSYLLLMELKCKETIQIGKLGKIDFKKGFYVYVGSAINGLEPRINRHLREEKKIHWHIDFLLNSAEIINVFYKENSFKEECKISNEFKKKLQSVKKYGCSDCKCKSHLFYGTYKEIMNIIQKLKMKQFPLKENT